MPGLEGDGGPSPAELGIPAGGTEAAPVAPAEAPVAPTTNEAPQRGWRGAANRAGEVFQRGRERFSQNWERAKENGRVSRERDRQIKRYAEIIKHGASSPQEVQDAMAKMSFAELRDAEQRNKYGGSAVGKLKAFMAGERDFKINDDEAVRQYYQTLNELRTANGAEPTREQHAEQMGMTVEQLNQIQLIEDANVLKEAGRRLVSTFANRRTALSAGVYLAMGALTAGFGWAAGGVLLGGAAGRGLAEMSELFGGKTREAREHVLFAERARWERMQALALEIQAAADDPARQGKLGHELVDLVHRQGESGLIRDLAASEKELSKREEKFNRLRSRLQTTGELVGAAAGITSILNGGVEHIDMDFFNKVDGQSVFHGVQQTQHGWNFLYSSGAEAGKAVASGAHILAAGQFGAHALEATTSQVVAYTLAERTLPMLLASGLAAGGHSRRTRELASAMGIKRLSPDRYYVKRDPNGKQSFYTRGENGAYQRWELQKSETGSGEEKKKEKKWVATDVAENDVPEGFRDRFRDFAAEYQANKAERLHGQIGTTAEYVKGVADRNGNPIPETPRGYTYDWNEQPKAIDVPDISPDRWYLRRNVNGKDEPATDPDTGKIIDVGVLGVDVANNRIVYGRGEALKSGATHVPVQVARLDHFLEHFRLHLNPVPGSENNPPENSAAPSPTPGPENPTTAPGTETPATHAVKDEAAATRAVDEHGDDIANAFLNAYDGGGPGPTPGGVEYPPLPPEYQDMTRQQLFEAMADKVAALPPELQESLGAAHGGQDQKDFIRYVDNEGTERIITMLPKERGGWRLDLSKRLAGQDAWVTTKGKLGGATQAEVRQFMETFLANVGDTPFPAPGPTGGDPAPTADPEQERREYVETLKTMINSSEIPEEANGWPLNPEDRPILFTLLTEMKNLYDSVPTELRPDVIIDDAPDPAAPANFRQKVIVKSGDGSSESLVFAVDRTATGDDVTDLKLLHKGPDGAITTREVTLGKALDMLRRANAVIKEGDLERSRREGSPAPEPAPVPDLSPAPAPVPVPEPSPTPQPEEPPAGPVDQELTRLGVADINDLVGKQVTLRDPQGYLSSTTKAQVSGNLRANLSGKTMFEVESIDEDGIHLRVNGFIISAEPDDILPVIRTVV